MRRYVDSGPNKPVPTVSRGPYLGPYKGAIYTRVKVYGKRRKLVFEGPRR